MRDANINTNAVMLADRFGSKAKPIAIKYEAFKELKPLGSSRSPQPRK